MGLVELVVQDARQFKSFLDAIANLVDESAFEVSKEGLKLRTMDPSQIAMVDFLLPKEAFSKLDADEARMIGLNLVDLSKVLARARSEERLSISVDEKESRLILEFTGESKRRFKLPLIDLGAAFPKEPKIPFDATIRIRGGVFKDMLRDAGLLSSHVVLEASAEEIVVEAHGDAGDLRIETPKKTTGVEELKASSSSRAMYPFEYLDDMTRACPDDEVIEVHLKTDAPVKLSYSIGPAKLTYFLAPRVESI